MAQPVCKTVSQDDQLCSCRAALRVGACRSRAAPAARLLPPCLTTLTPPCAALAPPLQEYRAQDMPTLRGDVQEMQAQLEQRAYIEYEGKVRRRGSARCALPAVLLSCSWAAVCAE